MTPADNMNLKPWGIIGNRHEQQVKVKKGKKKQTKKQNKTEQVVTVTDDVSEKKHGR